MAIEIADLPSYIQNAGFPWVFYVSLPEGSDSDLLAGHPADSLTQMNES